jgi:simple sugar transport system ATP-binding protein
VSVSFGDFRALTDVSVAFDGGRLHVLVGQNGAGKTTLARVLTGLIRPDAGELEVDGRSVQTGDVSASRAAGVEMVHQSFTLPPSFTVAESLELFSQRSRRSPVYSMRALNDGWREELAASGVDVRPSARIRELPIESVQAVEITRALASNANVLILDEPTAVLPPPAIERLFERLRRLRDRGVTVILVLHKLREVSAIAETVTVLRDGLVVLAPSSLASTTTGELSDLIVGAGRARVGAPMEVVAAAVHEEAGPRELLQLTDVQTAHEGTEPALTDVNLVVRRREIVGVAGVEGNGQRALVRVITGLTTPAAGRVRFAGEDVTGQPAGRRRGIGVRAVPFDRNLQGVSQSSPLWENVAILPVVSGGSGARLLRVGRLRADAARALDQWRVQYRSIDQRAGELSGGNVQRLILARELLEGVRLLVAAQPTRGLDIAATDFVRITLRELREADGAVVLISSDLDELFELSDRLIVILAGRIVAEFRPPYDVRAVGDAMVGADREGLAVPAIAMETEAVE